MANQIGSAVWHGGLKDGRGNVSSESGALNATYSFGSRFEDDKSGTNPEELVGAALSGCYVMFLSSLIEKQGFKPKHVHGDAKVSLSKDDRGPFISRIELTVEGSVEGLQEADFQKLVQEAKANCPISRAVAGVPEITVSATLNTKE